MKITNKANLPEPLVRAIQLDPYGHDCDFSTTTLIKPPRIVALERQHEGELEEDAADRIWALMGQLGHLVLERAGVGQLVERRFKIRCQNKTVGGQVDLWNNSTLLDYKFTSIWSATAGVKPEWEQQMNINAFLCGENGLPVKQSQIVCIFRDWSVGESRRNRDYPQHQVMVFDVPMWPALQQAAWIYGRVQVHMAAQSGKLPECTPLERWAKPDKWAVMKRGGKRAVMVLDSEEEANKRAMTNGYYVEYRPGVNTRCEDYCSVAPWCSQFKALKDDARRTAKSESEVSGEQNSGSALGATTVQPDPGNGPEPKAVHPSHQG